MSENNISRIQINDQLFNIIDQSSDEKINELSAKINELEDYTAFEVFAHDYNIPSGQVCEELGGYINNEISGSLDCRFVIRSLKSPEEQDTIIDWGDGTICAIIDCIAANNDNESEFISLLYHHYETSGKYIIKIYGKDYFSFCSVNAYSLWKPLNQSNLLCRIFEKDLPIASHVRNLSSAAHTSLRLLNLNNAYSLNEKYLAYTFKNCKNLLTANGFGITISPTSIYDTFNGCTSLISSTLRLISVISDPATGINGTYAFCAKLNMNVEDLLPLNGFVGKTINIQNTFVNCKLLSGTIPANFLWNDKNLNFINTDKTFKRMFIIIKSQNTNILGWNRF